MIGRPTALIEVDGFRLLSDPAFDPPGEYRLPHVLLRKAVRPALTVEKIGRVDAVLLTALPRRGGIGDNVARSTSAYT